MSTMPEILSSENFALNVPANGKKTSKPPKYTIVMGSCLRDQIECVLTESA